MTNQEITQRLNARDETAVAPFLAQFHQLAFVTALRRSYDVMEARTIANDVLADLALMALGGRPLPLNVVGYISAATSNAVQAAHRRNSRRWHRHDLAEECGQVVSEYTYRTARGPGLMPPQGTTVAVPAVLTPGEIALMTMVGDGWTQQQIADELHIGREAAKKRIARLRRRMQATYVA